MFKNELFVLDKYIKNNIIKKFICINQFKVVFFVLFVRKLEENIRLYVDYRDFNVITIKNRYSLFLVKKTLMRLCRIKHFNIIDIIVAFNKFRMILEKKWQIVFRTRYEFFEYLIMFFDLVNVLAIW